jgi:hypothetical protein
MNIKGLHKKRKIDIGKMKMTQQNIIDKVMIII